MNPYLAVAGLVAASAAMFMLPLIPALVEFKRHQDDQPLKVIQEHAGEIRFFSDGFRNYINPLQAVLQECFASGGNAKGMLADGAEYLVLGRGEDALTLPLRQQDETCSLMLATNADLVLPADTTFSRDIYAGGGFIGGMENKYRAILGEKDVQLGHGSKVMRWVHAVGAFRAEECCDLYGRVSSDSSIRLRAGCTFLRLNAPRIEAGSSEQTAAANTRRAREARTPSQSPRRLQDGDFVIGPDEEFTGDLVVRGKLRVGEGARVWGSVKSEKEMTIEDAVLVGGSLISATTARIGANCAIYGPVIAERELEIQAGTSCGSPEHPTTVSAPRIRIEEGVVVFGTLWAREKGQVVDRI